MIGTKTALELIEVLNDLQLDVSIINKHIKSISKNINSFQSDIFQIIDRVDSLKSDILQVIDRMKDNEL